MQLRYLGSKADVSDSLDKYGEFSIGDVIEFETSEAINLLKRYPNVFEEAHKEHAPGLNKMYLRTVSFKSK
jgi:hypothetical protein